MKMFDPLDQLQVHVQINGSRRAVIVAIGRISRRRNPNVRTSAFLDSWIQILDEITLLVFRIGNMPVSEHH